MYSVVASKSATPNLKWTRGLLCQSFSQKSTRLLLLLLLLLTEEKKIENFNQIDGEFSAFVGVFILPLSQRDHWCIEYFPMINEGTPKT